MAEAITTTTTIHLNGSAPTKGSIVNVGSKRYHMGDTAPITTPKAANGTSAPKKAVNGVSASNKSCLWFEEELEEDLRWVFGVSKILHTGVSEFQDIQLVESGPFGKVLILDGKLQSAEADEFVYHESIIHPAMLYHKDPKNVFIMGGGEGSTAREALRHKSAKKVVMCDIDKEVVDFCREHLSVNSEAFKSRRLELVIADARAELERREETFDIIIGDLADPVDGGPCYRLYTQSFYESVLKPRLAPGGILVTQAGPAGILTHTEVFTSIYNTLRQVFKYVVPYAAHIPSYADSWGWVMASDHPFPAFNDEETDSRISKRLTGDLQFLDGTTMSALFALNKHVRKSLAQESHVYTEETARFIHGHGTNAKSH
ncbi:spermidine synthase [Marchantia polymorpha subsp. ruderalis]|uniref:thermospermine synthase n=2 Tax=Marchantia polymorpha TaxID=3197 RepID=A0A176W456_MARPO|nr:hypothetical protein AXG93_2167s1080 [Marchantia polymorpha subsp. ruderalis]PTQ46153.1 hypothetical protein MARPO_0012s0100 [Marchantia polymorpha]BBN18509.1 hypothetical protein Mp_8g03070 [Marchantia polymorpha subsp. ruderalis]BDZ85479.1 thermospermine synthase-like protein [Marchantia polymorpha]|eukprot:PTQ46153.1 hypothetical protein MARPO_0012s0100 [Marchantia polymorpha]